MLYLQQLKLHVSQQYHHFTNVGPTNPDSSHSFSQHWHLWQYFWPNIDRLRWCDVIWFIVRRNCYRLVRCCLNAFSMHYYANIIPTILFQVSRWTIVGPACFKVLASFNSRVAINFNHYRTLAQRLVATWAGYSYYLGMSCKLSENNGPCPTFDKTTNHFTPVIYLILMLTQHCSDVI